MEDHNMPGGFERSKILVDFADGRGLVLASSYFSMEDPTYAKSDFFHGDAILNFLTME